MICSKPVADAPFNDEIIESSGATLVGYRDDLTVAVMMGLLSDFEPDILLVSGWMFRDYLAISRAYKSQGGKVVAFCDTEYVGSIRQQVGTKVARWVLHPAIDAIWVAGERQRDYAKRLGYSGRNIWEPMLCCDWDAFAAAKGEDSESGSGFLFVGRLVQAKAFGLLLRAYLNYRKAVDQPWPLKVAGTGPMATIARSMDGVELMGFIQPSKLPAIMAGSRAFVLPSIFEPWGVALQEAATVGLPLIASDACGASVHLLHDRWNGYLIESGSEAELTQALIQMHNLPADARRAMGAKSHELSKAYTPKRWVETLSSGFERLVHQSTV